MVVINTGATEIKVPAMSYLEALNRFESLKTRANSLTGDLVSMGLRLRASVMSPLWSATSCLAEAERTIKAAHRSRRGGIDETAHLTHAADQLAKAEADLVIARDRAEGA